MAAPRGSRAAGQRKMSLRAGGHIVAKGGHPNSYNLAAPNLHHNKAPGPEDGPRTSPEQPEAGGCELAQSRKSTGLEATSNYACVSRGRREQQIALIWDTQGKHSWLKLSTIFDATEYSPPWLAKALPRIFKFTSTLSQVFLLVIISLRISRSSYPTSFHRWLYWEGLPPRFLYGSAASTLLIFRSNLYTWRSKH